MILRDLPALAKVLKDETSLRILCLLRNQDMCACDLVSVTELSPVLLSEHLHELIRVGAIESRNNAARRKCYSMVRPRRNPLAEAVRELTELFWDDPRIREDRSQLAIRRLASGKGTCGADLKNGDEPRVRGPQTGSSAPRDARRVTRRRNDV